MDLFVNPQLQYVRASQDPASAIESYEFAIRVRLDNTKGKAKEAGETPAGAG